MATFDDLLEEAGTFGRCQKRIFALLCLLSIPVSAVYVGIVFQGFTPDHWCRDAAVVERRQACSWSLSDSRRLTALVVNNSGVLQQSSCEQYEVDWNNTRLTCDSQELNLTNVPVTACKDGWEYQYEGRKSLVTEFNLVCSDAWLVDMYQSILNVGFLIGSFAFGYLADRFGRRVSIMMSNILNLIAGIVLAVVPNYISILVVRCIFGFGVKGGWMNGYVLLTEMVGAEYRRTVGIVYQMFFSVGNLILPLLAYYITDWRWLQVVITAPYLFFLPYYWFIPESPRWLISQKNTAKALEITEAMAKENKKKLSKNFETVTEDEGDSPSASLLDLFRTPNMRKHTFILMFNWFTSAVVYQGLIMRVGIAGGNVYIDFLISGLVEFPAAFLILITIERIGRRLPFAAANIVAGAACVITAFIPDSMFWFKTVVACIGRLGITMAFEMVVFVNTELYPTFIRNLGVSVCSTLCDIGGIVSPFLLYRLAFIWLELPLIIFGVVAFVAGGLVLLLPETRGVPLPETLDDIEWPIVTHCIFKYHQQNGVAMTYFCRATLEVHIALDPSIESQ
uniref:Solute carrier family 22 member 3 n=1 Tax=Sparus aurata TaxID=8175 RepID=A0A671V1H7_SPAAU